MLADRLRAEEGGANLARKLELGQALRRSRLSETEIELVLASGHAAVDVAEAAVRCNLGR